MDNMNQNDESLEDIDPYQLLREAYPCIGLAITFELEHANYEEIERLKKLRRKIEKLVL
jgi:hypothetical protein